MIDDLVYLHSGSAFFLYHDVLKRTIDRIMSMGGAGAITDTEPIERDG